MKKIILAGAVLAAFSLSSCAYEHEHSHVNNLRDGNYNKSVKYTDKYGTTYSEVDKTRIETDSDGDRKIVSESEKTKDPKGWFNKKTISKKRVYIDDQH